MPLLLTAWPTIREFVPYVLGALLLIAAYLWIYDRGWDAQKARDAGQISALNQTITDVRAATAKARADDAARPADGACETAELDANACAEAVTKAQGWRDW